MNLHRWTFLTHHRIKAGHTRLSLARECDVNVSTISRLEAGLRGTRPKLYRSLAAALDVDLDDLIASAPTPVPQSPWRPAQEQPEADAA